MKTGVLIISFFCSIVVTYAQENNYYDFFSLDKKESMDTNKSNQQSDIFRTHFSLGLNSSFIFSPGNITGTTIGFSPNINYQIADRLILRAGFSADYSNFTYTFGNENFIHNNSPLKSLSLYATGNYKITDKFSLTGSTYNYRNDFKSKNMEGMTYEYKFSVSSLGLNYSLTPSVNIGVRLNFMQSSTNYNAFYYPSNYFINNINYNPYLW